MSSPVAHHCPDCKAEIASDLRTCIQCGADVGFWPESQRTPLILPGNPALSVDVVRKKTSVPKLVAAGTAAAALIGAVLYYMPERDAEDLAPLAARAAVTDTSASPPVPVTVPEPVATATTATPPEQVTADSLAAFSYGDTALTRSVPSAAPARTTPIPPPVVTPVPAPTPAPRVAAPVVAAAPVRRAPAVIADEKRTPAPRPAAVAAATPSRTVAPSGVLAIVPVVSNALRPGERLQLRWTVLDRKTRRAIPRARVEFTSTDAAVANVNELNGLVVARTPGTARIIIDAGAAGQSTVTIVVRAPAPSPVVTVAPTPTPDLSRSTAANTPAPVSTPAPAPARESPPVRETPRMDLPDAGEIRTVVDRFVRDVRRDAVRNAAVSQFLADGADHRVMLVGGPNILSNTAMGVRVAFDLRFTKFDGGGRPVTRVSSVTMDVDKREGQPSSSAVAIGSLRRP